MKIAAELEKLLNEQMMAEIESWYLYRALAAWFQDQNLEGFAHWMEVQAEEELYHANRIRDYLYKRDNKVHYSAMAEPKITWNSPLQAMEAVLEHEIEVSVSIDQKCKKAMEMGDLGVVAMLRWFVKEQEEEEETPRNIIDQMKLYGDKGCMLYRFNKKLGKREEDDFLEDDPINAE
jgi:ferritin